MTCIWVALYLDASSDANLKAGFVTGWLIELTKNGSEAEELTGPEETGVGCLG